MIPAPRTVFVTAAVAALLTVPGTAAAKGGGSTPAPAPDPNAVQCDYSLDGYQPNGQYAFSNQIGDAGCLTVTTTSRNTIALLGVAITPGWSYQADSVTGGVRVTFTTAGSQQSITAKIVPGKTEIKS